MERAILQENIERGIRFEGANKPSLVVDPDVLEVEIFIRLKGSTSEPKKIGDFPVSAVKIGKEEE